MNDFVFKLKNTVLEFKPKNESKQEGAFPGYYSYEEAMELFGKPDKDGWRLPTKEELAFLVKKYKYRYEGGNGIFDDRLVIPACGYVHRLTDSPIMENRGFYLTASPADIGDLISLMVFDFKKSRLSYDFPKNSYPVRLVRERN